MTTALSQAWERYNKSDYPGALMRVQAVLAVTPDHPLALTLQAMCEWWMGGDMARAQKRVKAALKRAPNVARVHHSLGTLHMMAGQLDLAERQFTEALELSPGNYGTFYNLTQVKRFKEIDAIVSRMQQVADRSDLEPIDRELISFGLAKVHNDLGDYEKAMHYCLQANAAAQGFYDPKAAEIYLKGVKRLAETRVFANLPDSGLQTEKPVFIIGMPRSGTTLIETMLGQHNRVRACGELPDVANIALALSKSLPGQEQARPSALEAMQQGNAAELRRHGQEMLDKVHQMQGGSYSVFTDKMPPNGLNLGLIARLFPKARIIRMRRDARDCCVSNLFTRLPRAYGYKTRQDWLGHYHTFYQRVVDIWLEALPLRSHEVSYEALATNPEPVMREVLDFLELDWDANCLSPEQSGRDIKTSSLWQARQPVNAGSVGRWKRYESQIGPLLEALERPLD